jgi:hypothetical protein
MSMWPSRSAPGRAPGCSISAAAGAPAELHPRPGCHWDRCDEVLQAGGCVSPTRSRRPSARRAQGHARDLRGVRRGGVRRRLGALLLTRRLPRRPPRRDLPPGVRQYPERAARRRSDGRFYMQSIVWGPNMIPVEEIDIDALRALPERGRRVDPRAPGAPVSRLLASVWSGAAHPQRRAAFPVGGKHQRTARLHRDHHPVESADRRPRFSKDAVQASASPTLVHQRRLPAGVDLRCQRQQGLLRARTARALPARIPDTPAVNAARRSEGLA